MNRLFNFLNSFRLKPQLESTSKRDLGLVFRLARTAAGRRRSPSATVTAPAITCVVIARWNSRSAPGRFSNGLMFP